MIVKLSAPNSDYPDLTSGQAYCVIGIEADDYRILNDLGKPYLYPASLFTLLDDREPVDWVSSVGPEGERYAYPSALNEPGFFEDFFDGAGTSVAAFWQSVNQQLSRAA
ncbi:hypothetical protein [Thiocystis violacea]|uniref:hypothetical protein n=1 Tax=Thiocystis violacea TaxID=13725 RepID=UPI001903CEA3|nr:hypothetical protein [Thiocystis violacea]MBK1718019.1 hypothetical protein [Thiocystis violacea]